MNHRIAPTSPADDGDGGECVFDDVRLEEGRRLIWRKHLLAIGRLSSKNSEAVVQVRRVHNLKYLSAHRLNL